MNCKKCFGRGIVWVGVVTVAIPQDWPPSPPMYYGLPDCKETPCDLCGGSGREAEADVPSIIGENS